MARDEAGRGLGLRWERRPAGGRSVPGMRRNPLPPTGTTRRTAPGAVSALALAAALALGACSGGSESPSTDDAASSSAPDSASATGGDEASATGGDQAGATVDTEALPDPVAEVNGEPISKADFVEAFDQQRAAGEQQAQAGGAPVDEVALRDSVLDLLVDSALITQEGERLGLEASDEEIDAELDSLAEQNGLGSRDELVALLGEQGVDEEQVREEVTRIVLVDEVIAEQGDVEPPSDAELQDYYDELTGGQDGAAASGEAGMPPFEDVKDQLSAQLTQEKENEVLTTLLEDLRADAEVTSHL